MATRLGRGSYAATRLWSSCAPGRDRVGNRRTRSRAARRGVWSFAAARGSDWSKTVPVQGASTRAPIVGPTCSAPVSGGCARSRCEHARCGRAPESSPPSAPPPAPPAESELRRSARGQERATERRTDADRSPTQTPSRTSASVTSSTALETDQGTCERPDTPAQLKGELRLAYQCRSDWRQVSRRNPANNFIGKPAVPMSVPRPFFILGCGRWQTARLLHHQVLRGGMFNEKEFRTAKLTLISSYPKHPDKWKVKQQYFYKRNSNISGFPFLFTFIV